MILRRIGSKALIAERIQTFFPEHKLYIEPFFGCGGMFFNKRKAQFNILNDLNDEVFNLYNVLMNQKDELKHIVRMTPIHESLLAYWKENKETDPIRKAMRFLYISNYTVFGMGAGLRLGMRDSVKYSLSQIDKTYNFMYGVQFANCDFRAFFKKIEFKSNEKDTFIYCDPPYLDTVNPYETGDWTEKDSEDLFTVLQSLKVKWAMSEFEHPFLQTQIDKYHLNVIQIGKRINLKNKRVEILITNYDRPTRLFY